MEALVLEKAKELNLRDIDIQEELGPHDVRIKLHTVGVCGSDVHYYETGRIGPFVVEEPMILGHEASGTIIEIGDEVKNLKVGDRVCMEPGVPDPNSKATRLGKYNLDPAVRFWATPPIHGVLRPEVVHPAAFTFKLPDNVSFAEGALVEPLAVGMHSANKAQIKPGDVAIVMGAGPIGMVTILAALAGGCGQIIVTDVVQPVVNDITGGWGADIVFEASGNEKAAASVFDILAPGGCVVYIGMPDKPIAYDIVAAQIKEARVEHVFRYAHVYPKALSLMGSGRLNVKPLITDKYDFSASVEAFEFAAHMPPTSVKVQIELPQ